MGRVGEVGPEVLDARELGDDRVVGVRRTLTEVGTLPGAQGTPTWPGSRAIASRNASTSAVVADSVNVSVRQCTSMSTSMSYQ